MGVHQIEPPLDPFDAVAQAIDAHRLLGDLDTNLRDFALDRAHPRLYFTHVLARFIDCAPDMAQMLKNEILRFGH
jgi:hypothetical protein